MKILDEFSEEQRQMLKDNDIDLEKDFDKKELEELEDKIYGNMMDNLDKNQEFTQKAEEWEEILDIIVEIENIL